MGCGVAFAGIHVKADGAPTLGRDGPLELVEDLRILLKVLRRIRAAASGLRKARPRVALLESSLISFESSSTNSTMALTSICATACFVVSEPFAERSKHKAWKVA